MSLLVQTFSLLRNNKGEPPSINNGGGSQATSKHSSSLPVVPSLSSTKLSFLQNLLYLKHLPPTSISSLFHYLVKLHLKK